MKVTFDNKKMLNDFSQNTKNKLFYLRNQDLKKKKKNEDTFQIFYF